MKKVITLKWPARCRDCGAELPAGARARYYGRGQVYGVHCHEGGFPVGPDGERHLPARYWDAEEADADLTWDKRRGGYTRGVGGPCEDAPCCGHGGRCGTPLGGY